MTIDEFQSFIEVSIDGFVSHFREMNKVNSKLWPNEYESLSDWWDQFFEYTYDKLGDSDD